MPSLPRTHLEGGHAVDDGREDGGVDDGVGQLRQRARQEVRRHAVCEWPCGLGGWSGFDHFLCEVQAMQSLLYLPVESKPHEGTYRLAPERFSRMNTFTSEGNACQEVGWSVRWLVGGRFVCAGTGGRAAVLASWLQTWRTPNMETMVWNMMRRKKSPMMFLADCWESVC
jgi:hypothetical protein